MGVALEANGALVKDARWVQPENDTRLINLAEFDATLKGVNRHFGGNPGFFTSSQTQCVRIGG